MLQVAGHVNLHSHLHVEGGHTHDIGYWCWVTGSCWTRCISSGRDIYLMFKGDGHSHSHGHNYNTKSKKELERPSSAKKVAKKVPLGKEKG